MARILVLLPDEGFDPGEVALPWQAWTRLGHAVAFASESGRQATCDPITLSGQGLPPIARWLRAHSSGRASYAELQNDPAWHHPLRWNGLSVTEFDAVHFPGGHAPEMRRFCESPVIAALARDAFAANMPVAAVCHGVLPLARAGVLAGRVTTSLTASMENISVALTARTLPGHYRTYPETVEAEVRRTLGANGRYLRGPLIPRYSGERAPEAGFVVEDGMYVSGRWPGDSWTLALRLADRI